ncbi:MAG: hypothetical protein CME70_04480 [Halobacteriovorax sp.]|nr:hypothetical protein [Halobacteriovorax sp.]|tara:strand:+ start:12024 stop:12392 length:369 start_codon:yes stop_codon:yes gene_type:complete
MNDFKSEEIKKKRGRRPRGFREEYVLDRSKSKFYVDLRKDRKALEKVFKLLEETNKKDFGCEITFKELAMYALGKLTEKDIEKIKESSLSEMEKVEKSLNEYNEKNGTNLNLGEYLVKKLSI